jgi:hypothetical protein
MNDLSLYLDGKGGEGKIVLDIVSRALTLGESLTQQTLFADAGAM